MSVSKGDVRREKPRAERYSGGLVYAVAAFKVLDVDGPYAIVCGLSGKPTRRKLVADIGRCPKWPEEHEAWRGARGHRVST